MFKELQSEIYIPTKRGENTKQVNLSAKGKSSQRAKHVFQMKIEAVDKAHSKKVQKSIDKVNTYKAKRKEIEQLKKATKNRRAMFAAKRKGEI